MIHLQLTRGYNSDEWAKAIYASRRARRRLSGGNYFDIMFPAGMVQCLPICEAKLNSIFSSILRQESIAAFGNDAFVLEIFVIEIDYIL
jgi:hypothetical protein